MSDIQTSTFSETAASNSAATPNGWPEGQSPSTVNDCAREMMGAIKREWNRSHPTVTAGGTGTALTLTYTTAPPALVQGLRFSFIAAAANSGAATLAVNGLAATAIKKPGSSGLAALAGGEIQAGQVVEVAFDGTQFVMTSPIAYGTAAGQAVALDSSAKLPAVDGSQLTGIISVPSGAMLPYGGSAAPTGWLLCDGSAVSRTTYAALFTAIGTAYGAGDGSSTFNVPDLRGRSVVGAGTGATAETLAASAVTAASDTIAVASNADKWTTGKAVQLTTTGGLPGGLATATTYYVIRSSSTAIKLATSLANAVAGTAIDLTSQGTGNHTLTETLTARSRGDVGGEEGHSITRGELPSHFVEADTNSQDSVSTTTSNVAVLDGANRLSIGNNDRGNNMAPYGVANWIIRT